MAEYVDGNLGVVEEAISLLDQLQLKRQLLLTVAPEDRVSLGREITRLETQLDDYRAMLS